MLLYAFTVLYTDPEGSFIMADHRPGSDDDFAADEKVEADARFQGSQAAKAVVALHVQYPALPALELFDVVLEPHRGSNVEFDLQAGDKGGFYELMIEAFAPLSADDSAPGADLDEEAEGREILARQACSLRFDLNGMKGREAWAAEFGARRIALNRSRSLPREVENGRRFWDRGHWLRTGTSIADDFESSTSAPQR
jgi:hypothetical protein